MLSKILNSKTILILILLLALVLRGYQVNSLPSLNPDEAALGYNAYSLLLTGKDEHGATFPLHFKSFGDYKPGGYIYLATPFIKLLGLTPLAVRLPNLILSILTILFLYLLVKKISNSTRLGLLSALVLTLSPWHIHFSRGAWESCTALSFIVFGLYFFYSYLQNQKSKFLFLFVFFFAMSLYFYHSARIVAPVIAFGLFVIHIRQLIKKYHQLIIAVIFGIIMTVPVGISFLRNGGTARFGGVGLTADPGPSSRSEELLNQHGNVKLINRIVHNKRVLYAISWAEKYTSHFDPNFLFINGDEVPRSKSPDMGQLHLIELPLLILGIYYLLESKNKNLKSLVITLILVSPLASSLTFQAPSALRSLPLVIPLTILVSLGLFQLGQYIQKIPHLPTRYFSYTVIFFLYSFSLLYFYDAYFNHAPRRYPFAWNTSFNQIIPFVTHNSSRFDHVYFTDKYDQPYILYLFFSKYPPQNIQKQIRLTPPDRFGFSTVRQIDNITFEKINWDSIPKSSLVIAATETVPITPITSVLFPNGQPGFKIYVK